MRNYKSSFDKIAPAKPPHMGLKQVAGNVQNKFAQRMDAYNKNAAVRRREAAEYRQKVNMVVQPAKTSETELLLINNAASAAMVVTIATMPEYHTYTSTGY